MYKTPEFIFFYASVGIQTKRKRYLNHVAIETEQIKDVLTVHSFCIQTIHHEHTAGPTSYNKKQKIHSVEIRGLKGTMMVDTGTETGRDETGTDTRMGGGGDGMR